MRLFRAFDEIEDMKSRGRELLVDPPTLESVLGSLDIG